MAARWLSPAAGAAVVETHISVLVFVGDRVWKVRKPVRFGFLDFSDRAARLDDCRREVEVNRRLAPDVYLGVADVVLDGVAVDHMVVMRRLPGERRLAALVRAETGAEPCVRRLARVLAAFHAKATRSASIDRAASPEALLAAWDANLAEAAPFVGPVLDPATDATIADLSRQYLVGRGPLLVDRIARGHVCDGHGDLQAEDVFCLDDGPRVLDCIEFDDRLRHVDVAADLAFMLMDLERLGAPGLARLLQAQYEELSGEVLPGSLVHHYVAARAYVRAKVGCLRAAQGDAAAVDAARALHRMAADHLRTGRVRLVLVGGLPGTGKSVLADGIGAALDADVLRTDEVRHELADVPVDATTPAAYGEGLYDAERTAATYRTVLERARVALAMGRSVVVDASMTAAVWRRRAGDVAAATHSELAELELRADPAVAALRIARRRRSGPSRSDATEAVAAAMAARADAWPTATAVDASGLPERTLALALAALDAGALAAGPAQA
jgi:hypothetical protein